MKNLLSRGRAQNILNNLLSLITAPYNTTFDSCKKVSYPVKKRDLSAFLGLILPSTHRHFEEPVPQTWFTQLKLFGRALKITADNASLEWQV